MEEHQVNVRDVELREGCPHACNSDVGVGSAVRELSYTPQTATVDVADITDGDVQKKLQGNAASRHTIAFIRTEVIRTFLKKNSWKDILVL